MSNEAILEIPNVVVISGPAGQSLLVVQSAADLVADFGREGDRAVIRTTGDEWLKTAGVWAATSANFWGTLLQQGSDKVDLARRWAEEAPDVEVDGGFSALHWAGRAALIAAMFGDLQSAMTAIDQAVSAAAGSATTATAKADETAADVVSTHADVVSTHADVITTAATLASAQAARDASLYGKGIFPTTAAAIGLGVVGNGVITPGSGGTNGTFDLAFTGGTGSGAAGRFVVAGGALTSILITAPGSYTVAPAFSFAASAGLAGAAAAVVLGKNADVGEYFWTEVSAGVLGLYNVTAGPAATDTGIRAATSALISNVDTIAMLEGLSVPTAKLTEAAGSVSPSVYRSYSFVSGDTIEHVVIAKAAERGSLQLIHAGAGAAYTANFDLDLGVVASTSGANIVSASITDLGSGWYECKAVVLVAANITNNVQARMSPSATLPYTGDGTSGMYVRSIVLRKQGLTANLFPSSDPANAAFTKQNVTVTTTTSPHEPALVYLPPLVDELDVIVSGRMTASKVIEPGVSGSPSTWQGKSVVAGDLIVWEVIAKKGERKRLNLFSNNAALIDCTFDLDLGTVVQGGAAVTGSSCTALGKGWFLCRVEATATASASSNWQHRVFKDTGTHPYVGDGVSGLYIQRSSFRLNGGANIFGSAENLSSSGWSKSAGLTVTPNAALYLGLLSDPTTIGGDPYDDGSAELVGKKWAALGSSITIGAYYAPLLAGQTGMVLTNLGVSGSALGLSTTGYASYGMSAKIVDIPADTELVTLEPGPNAFGAQETPLGVFGNSTYDTVYGSIWKAIMDIRVQAPSAKIVLIGVYSGGPGHATHRIGRTNGQGNTMDQHMKAEREVCQALGVPYIDTSMSGMGYHTSTLYMSDELHPNAAGSLRLATHHAGALRKMVLNGLFVN
ncbi:SGNH/GDSL hydrolase family protein [Mesorhizobium sp.]|uniref:SGNH/GDSL hydrolase family protein n=1 Tax=Mesorhizobium sp. TaxID=1871066 RepID=UPI000FE76046|nr:SGNH/GDSL hydrolase family protein [Mesorhizobium sp.]RWO57317.1 MAG: SGNH/GDSL hydrolase family protein [Mesorhizobium sp.]